MVTALWLRSEPPLPADRPGERVTPSIGDPTLQVQISHHVRHMQVLHASSVRADPVLLLLGSSGMGAAFETTPRPGPCEEPRMSATSPSQWRISGIGQRGLRRIQCATQLLDPHAGATTPSCHRRTPHPELLRSRRSGARSDSPSDRFRLAYVLGPRRNYLRHLADMLHRPAEGLGCRPRRRTLK
jgi:hypothetical protein